MSAAGRAPLSWPPTATTAAALRGRSERRRGLPGDHLLRVQGAMAATLRSGLGALRPMAVAIRLIVATRLSFSGPRMAFWMKFGPPWPTVVASRLFASAIWVFSSARLLATSACACAGTAGSEPATPGQFTVGVAAVEPLPAAALVAALAAALVAAD